MGNRIMKKPKNTVIEVKTDVSPESSSSIVAEVNKILTELELEAQPKEPAFVYRDHLHWQSKMRASVDTYGPEALHEAALQRSGFSKADRVEIVSPNQIDVYYVADAKSSDLRQEYPNNNVSVDIRQHLIERYSYNPLTEKYHIASRAYRDISPTQFGSLTTSNSVSHPYFIFLPLFALILTALTRVNRYIRGKNND